MNEHAEPARNLPTLVVAVGASAGGLEACKRLLAQAPADQDLAFVVVMHLDPTQQSHIAEFLARVTPMGVEQVRGGEQVEPNRVYVIAPATSLGIRDGVLRVGDPDKPRYLAKPIDAFFSELAADRGARAAAVVLSGTGNNGSAGLREIHAAGGLCLVQDPASAEYDGMPRNAIGTGVADAIVPPEEMGELLGQYARPPHVRPARRPPGRVAPGPDLDGFSGILALLGERYGVDFGEYKKGTLERRTARRMGIANIQDAQAYLEHLRAHPAEVAALYEDVLIDVTSFFRDPPCWEQLKREVVPALLRRHDPGTPVRLWSAGCASGEEAYSLAMVFLEQIEQQGGRHSLQVFGTDLSHEALAAARRGCYPARIAEEIAPDRLRRFFRPAGEAFQVEKSLRDAVTFASLNLLSDPPFANLDLVSCRNVLIYLESQAQDRLFDLFAFSLLPGGILWLGGSETIGRRADLYEPLSAAHRLYRSLENARVARHRVPRRAAFHTPGPGLAPGRLPAPRGSNLTRPLEQLVLQRYAVPTVAINRSLEILHFFGPIEAYLERPTGEARMDFLSWARPGLFARLRAGLLEAMERNETVRVTEVRIERDTSASRIEVTIDPLSSPGLDGILLVSFRDLVAPADAADPSARDRLADRSLVQDLELELQNTRLELQNTVEQLETSNEEYRAGHEELLSLNEELQSRNEELEMSKEELQSLNEELTTVNRQLEDLNGELQTVASDLQNFLLSSDIPCLFLDRQFRIRRFTPACTRLMRIAEADTGRALGDLKLEVRDGRLLQDAGRVLAELTPLGAEVSTGDGRWYNRRILPYRTAEDRIDGVCITFHEVTAQKQASQESEQARRFAEAIVESSRTAMLVLDAELRVTLANRAFFEAFQVERDQTLGVRIFDLGNRQWDIPGLRTLLEQVLPRESEIRHYDVEHEFESIGWRAMRLNASVVNRPGGTSLILVSLEDITDVRRAEAAARSRTHELAQDHQRKDEFLAMLGHELRNPVAALASAIALLERSSSEPARVDRLAAMMARQTLRMDAMLDQLLDVARVISGKFEFAREAIDVADAVRLAVETVSAIVESAGQELSVTLPAEGEVLVLGDAVRLAQVVENLLVNASRYSEAQGRIRLAVGTSGDRVEISVRDNGIGMDPEMLKHAFDLFVQGSRTLERARGGLGLGLSLVRSLVELHGGQVVARSDGPGQGSEFVVRLPRLHTAKARPAPALPAGRMVAPPRRILLVDDEQDMAATLAELLALEGHEVRLAHDGQAALEAARQFRPDAVLLDLGLPAMDGYKVAERLRAEHGPDLLLVAVTGYDKNRERFERAGFDEHVLKPFQLDQLLGVLARGRAADPE